MPKPEEAMETPADEAAESPAEQKDEKQKGSELHDAPTMATIAQACAEEAAGYCQKLEAMIEQAKEAEGGDPKGLEKLLKECQGLADDAEKAAETAAKAADKEDIGGTAEAAVEAEQACKQCEELFKQAGPMAGFNPQPDPPEAGFNPQPDPPSGMGGPIVVAKGPRRPAMAVWADKD